jgi:hypothetical protein
MSFSNVEDIDYIILNKLYETDKMAFWRLMFVNKSLNQLIGSYCDNNNIKKHIVPKESKSYLFAYAVNIIFTLIGLVAVGVISWKINSTSTDCNLFDLGYTMGGYTCIKLNYINTSHLCSSELMKCYCYKNDVNVCLKEPNYFYLCLFLVATIASCIVLNVSMNGRHARNGDLRDRNKIINDIKNNIV